MKLARVIAVAMALLPAVAAAQSTPNWPQHFVPSAGTWNSLFGSKQDVNGDASGQHVTATGSSTARTLASRFADTINVLDYAVCDGVTNATATMNTAAANAAGHAALLIPAGVTCVTSGLVLPANSTLILDGTILQLPMVAANNYTVRVTGDQIAITGRGTIDGNVSHMTAGGNVQGGLGNGSGGFSGLYVGPITIQNTLNWPFNMVNQSNSLAFGTRFINGGNSVEYATSGTNDWFDHVYVNGNTDLAVGFYGGISGSGITNSYVTGGGAAGIFVLMDASGSSVVHDILIASNIVTGNTMGIFVGSNISTIHPRDIVVEGNDVYANTVGGIQLSYAQRTKVSGNWVHNNGYNAATFGDIFVNSSTTYAEITGNTITNPGQGSTLGCGIYLQAAIDATVSFNTIVDDQGTKTMAGGLCGSAGARTVVLDNRISGAIGAADQVVYDATSSGANFSNGTMRTSVNQQEGGLLSFVRSANGVTTGYNTSGIQLVWNFTGGGGEGDILVGPGGGSGGLNVYQLNTSGAITGGPIMTVSPTGVVGGVSFKANGVAGVSCAATTVSLTTLVVTGGIVTHC